MLEPCLSDEDEVEIVQVLAEMGFPLNVYYVGTVIKDYLTQQGRLNPFGDTGIPLVVQISQPSGGSQEMAVIIVQWQNF